MLNLRVLGGWPNWAIVPIMLALWVIVGVLGAELLGAAPFEAEQK